LIRLQHGFHEEARQAPPPGVSLIPVAVSSRKDIPAVLKGNFGEVDALWLVPDRTITTESLIRYIIREAIYNKVPVIGYNRFFYESGAVLSFIFDYREIGSQSGEGHGNSLRPSRLSTPPRTASA
jgi:putative ABC transport system substrate-binding protein